MTNARWDMGARDHEYVESITMYRAEDSGAEDSEDDLVEIGRASCRERV